MPNRRLILWQGLTAPSLERFILAPSERGFELRGLILRTHENVAYVARYTIGVDRAWVTREVQVEIEDGGRRSLRLTRTARGDWSRDGQLLPELEGCHDVDLEWSPSTNTLPVRRLQLGLEQVRSVTAAWIQFPSLEIERLDQSYERLGGRRYRYRSGRFSAELQVDEDGLVLDYASLWKAVASSGEMTIVSGTAGGPGAETIR